MSLSPVVPSLSEALEPFSAVVLTGGSSGIGKSFIELCETVKPNLVVCNLSRREPERKNRETGPIFLNHFPCDLSRPEEIARVAPQVAELLERRVPGGRVLLINNSGFGAFAAFPEPKLCRQLEMIDVNVRGLVQLTGLLLPCLRQRGGAILNVASTVAFLPTPYAATYGATKAFVLHWTLAVQEELRGSGVRALAVCPGTTRTAFFTAAGAGDRGIVGAFSQSSEQVAREALLALAGGRRQVVTGWLNWAYAALGARLPKPWAAAVAGRVMQRLRGSGGPEGES